jgi:hypothetical protein
VKISDLTLCNSFIFFKNNITLVDWIFLYTFNFSRAAALSVSLYDSSRGVGRAAAREKLKVLRDIASQSIFNNTAAIVICCLGEPECMTHRMCLGNPCRKWKGCSTRERHTPVHTFIICSSKKSSFFFRTV